MQMCPIEYQVYLLRRYLKIMRQKLIKSKSYIVSKLFVFKTKCNTFVLYFINLYFRLDVLILFLADHKCHGYDYFDFYLLQNILDHVCIMVYYRKLFYWDI